MSTRQPPRAVSHPARPGEEGYLLLGLVVTCFLLLLFLAVAAPRVAKQLERDREVESEHRAQEYVRAIQLYYRRTKRFPISVEELLGTGPTGSGAGPLKVRYLRQEYKDPLTGGEYRLILVGKAKTEVKGFFGEPLEGAPIGNLGSVAGMQSSPGLGNSSLGSGSALGAAGGTSGFSLGSNAAGASQLAQATPTAGSTGGQGTQPPGGTGATGASGTGTFGSGTDATTFNGSKGAFLGVGSNAKGHGLVEWNGSENIEEWEFLYDPRVELLKAKVSLFGGSPAASGNGSLGGIQGSGSSSFGGASSFGGSSAFGGNSSPAGSSGSGNGSSFGSSGFGSSGASGSQSGFGSSTQGGVSPTAPPR